MDLNQAMDAGYCVGCTSAPHWLPSYPCYFTGWRKTQPRLLSGLETSCWLMVLVFFKDPVSQLWRESSSGLLCSHICEPDSWMFAERRRRKKGILQFDLQRARLQRSFAAGDPDIVIKSDQRLITPGFFFITPHSSPNSPVAEHSPLCSCLPSMTERLWWTAWRWSIISPWLMISKLIWEWPQKEKLRLQLGRRPALGRGWVCLHTFSSTSLSGLKTWTSAEPALTNTCC